MASRSDGQKLLDLVIACLRAISHRTKQLLTGLLLRPTCRRSSPAPWSELPDDILALIIAGLPDTADLARFSSVCRSWRHSARIRSCSYPSSSSVVLRRQLEFDIIDLDLRRQWYSVSSPSQLSTAHSIRRVMELAYSSDTPASLAWRLIWSTLLCRRRQQPWIVLPEGFYLDEFDLAFSDCGPDPITAFPDDLTCVGSTDSWLALDYAFPLADADKKRRRTVNHAYLLHNPFSRETVSLHELHAVLDIKNVSDLFRIRKVLMRSGGADGDLVVVLTNNRNLPIIFTQLGGCALHPREGEIGGAHPLLVAIVDIAFLGGRLYGITADEDLVSFRFTFSGRRMTGVTHQRVIRSNGGDYDYGDDDANDGGGGGGTDDDDVSDDENSDVEEEEEDSDVEEDDEDSEEEEEENSDVEEDSEEEDEDENDNCALGRLMLKTGDAMVGDGIQRQPEFEISRYLVAEPYGGKLLMVWREGMTAGFTRKVEVFEADVNAGAWTPMSNGLGGRTLFISQRFSKCVVARGEVEPDAIYFADFGEVFSMKLPHLGTCIGFFSYLEGEGPSYRRPPTWIFPPN